VPKNLGYNEIIRAQIGPKIMEKESLLEFKAPRSAKN